MYLFMCFALFKMLNTKIVGSKYYDEEKRNSHGEDCNI